MVSNPSFIADSDNPLLLTYASVTLILCIKILSMSFLTARQRFRKGVFANPEDASISHAKVKFDDVDVERVRRAHLNDLENIPVFLVVSLLYITIGSPHLLPSVSTGKLLLWLFAAARIVHTLVYAVFVIPQPARALSFGVGLIITLYMGISTLIRICSISD